MNRFWLTLAATSLSTFAMAAAPWPYDEQANATADVQHAVAAA